MLGKKTVVSNSQSVYCDALQPAISYCYGARLIDRMRSIFRRVLAASVISLDITFLFMPLVGFSGWWGILLLGIAGAILGFLGLKNPDVAGVTLSWIIGCGIIAMGVSYLLALCGINRFEKKVGQIRSNIKAAIDEQ